MDYDLNRLGSLEFEHLVQALAIAELGITVSTFGAGADGGREATFTASGQSASSGVSGPWEGYGIVQAKSMRFPVDPATNAATLVTAVGAELDKLVYRAKQSPAKNPALRNYILATNARLSAGPGGGVDRLEATMKAHEAGLTGCAVWHYEHICRLLDRHAGIRKTFAGFITPGDVLDSLYRMLDGSPAKLGLTLKIHAASQLAAKEALKLDTTEISDTNKVRLSEVAIDLPARMASGSEVQIVSHLLEAGDESLRNSHRGDKPYGFVVMGGPGQGKSTVAQILAQAYRVGLLEGRAGGISPQVDSAIAATALCLDELKLRIPRNRRWPVVVELAAFADALAVSPNLTVTEYIASQLRAQGADIKSGAVAAWLATWPWLLALDGLDEVPARSSREAVVGALNELIVESRLADWDVMLICTTRPQGYNGEFSELNAQELELRYLNADEGATYGHRIVEAKYRDDPETSRRVLADLTLAIAQPHTTRLMRTPLQVTIMEFLLEELSTVPDTRHELFDGYYRAIYARESRKAGRLGLLLRKHAEQVDWVHEQIAFALQRNAELTGEAEASLPDGEVVALFKARFIEQEFDSKDIDRLSADLDRAVKQRLVLLVAKRDQELSFEVRSLQEYMAARAITTGLAVAVHERLAVLAPSAYWRNTWLLAMSRLYLLREYERDAMLERLRRLDSDTSLGAFIGYGARLAIDLLEDDFASAVPAHRRSLLLIALGQLLRWPGLESQRLSAIARQALNGDDTRASDIVRDSLQDAWKSSGKSRLAAMSVLRHLANGGAPSGRFAQALLRSAPSEVGTTSKPSAKRQSASRALAPAVSAARLTAEERGLWSELQVSLLQQVSTVSEASEAVVVSVSSSAKDWAIPEASRNLIETGPMQDLIIRVCNSSNNDRSVAVVLLRRAMIAVVESIPRGFEPALADIAAGIAVRTEPEVPARSK